MGRQIGWRHVPILSARLIAIEAILEQGEYVHDVVHEGRTLIDTYYNHANMITPHEVAGVPTLTASLERFWKRVQEDFPEARATGRATDLYEQLAQRTTRDICANCSASAPCTGHDTLLDSERLATGGACLSPFRGLCDLGHTLALATYRRHIGDAYVPKQISFCTGHLTRNNEASNIAFSASSAEADSNGDCREVCISFHVPAFDFGDFEQLLYALFHECFVHALCGVKLNGDSSYLSDRFHEGWMDYVAFLVLHSHLQKGADMPLAVAADLSGFLDSSLKAHNWRCDIRRVDRTSDTEINAFGKRAALAFAGFCRAVLGEIMGLEQTIRFSVLLNASDMSDAERGKIVEGVTKRLVGAQRFATAVTDDQLVKALKNFQREGNIMELLPQFL
ncbi:hypothetical protein SAMN04487926_10810 [Paraburkholderia steynii]|uniref:Uncharacterized protein n=1 Tax=Paraburkholderia steynii TaxID=1245441 RepID=A0A7Z7B5W9_9BURK|nr:hypothetical protein [Paraburkholderia steynii]SDH78192.1 hypothetical protein SAMN04487926_10810 [Paraburkholderia steynii]